MRFVVVTGTGTGVGKTVTTAALATVAMQDGLRVGVVKPAQTGTATDEPRDIETIRALSGCTQTQELVTLADPLAPDTAARLRQVVIPEVAALAQRTLSFAHDLELVMVEGAGGVLVRLDAAGGTVEDLATRLVEAGDTVDFVVVTTLALGTLNHTELTVRSLAAAGHRVAGLVVGSVPGRLGLAERCNLDELPRVTGLPVVGALPAGVGGWSPDRFRDSCRRWLPDSGWLTQRKTQISGRRSRGVPPAVR